MLTTKIVLAFAVMMALFFSLGRGWEQMKHKEKELEKQQKPINQLNRK